jgi:uncharacterized lipoprotein
MKLFIQDETSTLVLDFDSSQWTTVAQFWKSRGYELATDLETETVYVTLAKRCQCKSEKPA